MLDQARSSPKRLGVRRDADLYYYYAAFAQSFIEDKARELDLPPRSTILDPWCGSGTTLAVSRQLGYRSIGSDINPVSVVLTKSRFATAEDVDFVSRKLERAISTVSRETTEDQRPDTLLWRLRQNVLGSRCDRLWSPDGYRTLSPRLALLLTGLFFFGRKAMNRARSKNPGWLKRREVARLTATELEICYSDLRVVLDAFKLSTQNCVVKDLFPRVEVINNETNFISTSPEVDAVVTSPPYLTRLDYGVLTEMEWRILKNDPDAEIKSWRASFTGSVLTLRVPTSKFPLPRSISDIMRAIHAHSSKASRGYYFYFFRNYFVGIQNAIDNITASCKVGAKGIFVVQDSQFKDIDIPLANLFSDILTARGWRVDGVESFSIAPTFYRVNTKRWARENLVRTENLIWARRLT